MQLCPELGNGLGELLPDFDRKVFGRRKDSEHKRRVVIQVLMVEGLDHVLHHEGLEVDQIHDKARFGIDLAFDGNPNFEIVSVPVVPRTFAKKALIFFSAERIVVQAVGRTEHLAALNVHHGLLGFDQLGLQGFAWRGAKGDLCCSRVFGTWNGHAKGGLPFGSEYDFIALGVLHLKGGARPGSARFNLNGLNAQLLLDGFLHGDDGALRVGSEAKFRRTTAGY